MFCAVSICAEMFWNIPICTEILWNILMWIEILCLVSMCTEMFCSVSIFTEMFCSASMCAEMFCSISACTNMFYSVAIYVHHTCSVHQYRRLSPEEARQMSYAARCFIFLNINWGLLIENVTLCRQRNPMCGSTNSPVPHITLCYNIFQSSMSDWWMCVYVRDYRSN
jgi:hypothetical protein